MIEKPLIEMLQVSTTTNKKAQMIMISLNTAYALADMLSIAIWIK